MNIMALIEILDEELSNASNMPLTGKKLVDVDKCLDVISDLRINLPDDIKEAAIPVLAHRLVLKNDFYRSRGHDEEIVARLLEQVSVPTEEIDFYRYS